MLAADEQREPDVPELPRRPALYARRLLIAVGIDRYKDEETYPRLKNAKNDAARTRELLHAQGFQILGALNDEQATRSNMLELLHRQVVEGIGKDDLVVVFFAGHGATQEKMGYIIPHDATSDLRNSALSVLDLKESVLRWPNRHTLFVVDACFSGSMFRQSRNGSSNPLEYWQSRAEDRLVEILTAGDQDELSFEDDEAGFFTKALLAGLAGRADQNLDGIITGQELAGFTRAAVSRSSGGAQNPQWGAIEGEGTIPLSDAHGGHRQAPRVTRNLSVLGLDADLTRVQALIDARQFPAAEQLLRRLLLASRAPELNLILAELYLEQDDLANGRQAEGELMVAEQSVLSPDATRALIELRARVQRARRVTF